MVTGGGVIDGKVLLNNSGSCYAILHLDGNGGGLQHAPWLLLIA
jgi:hypothetical protein